MLDWNKSVFLIFQKRLIKFSKRILSLNYSKVALPLKTGSNGLLKMAKFLYGQMLTQASPRDLFWIFFFFGFYQQSSWCLSSNLNLLCIFFSVIHNIDTSANELNNNLYKINYWTFQCKMSFNQDPNKQSQDIIFRKLRN